MKKAIILISILTIVSAFAQPSISLVNIGSAGNDGTGDSIRAAFGKINTNFLALSNSVIDASAPIATGGGATVLIAASNSPQDMKDRADYVCDGTDDHVEWQAAIDSLPTEGGLIWPAPGVYYIADTLQIGDG